MPGTPWAGETPMVCQRVLAVEFVPAGAGCVSMAWPVAVSGLDQTHWQLANINATAISHVHPLWIARVIAVS